MSSKKWPGWSEFSKKFQKDNGLSDDCSTSAGKTFNDSVIVVYAESPSDFYVRYLRRSPQLYTIYKTVHVIEWENLQYPLLAEMPTEESFSSEDSADTNAADSLEVGQMVLAYQDVMGPDVPPLQRAQVKEVNCFEDIVVQYIDWGIVESVKLSSLRPLPGELMAIPRLAKHCALSKIYPMPETDSSSEDDQNLGCDTFQEWSNASRAAFCHLVKNHNGLAIKIMTESVCEGGPPAQVDLMLYKQGDPSSVRDVLVFEEYGCLANANYFAQRKLEELYAIGEFDEREEFEDIDDICFGPGVHSQSLEIQPMTLEPGSWLVARLSCIRTPEDIYIQPVKMCGDELNHFRDMEEKINSFYNKKDPRRRRDLLKRYEIQTHPVEGMMCVVRLDTLRSDRHEENPRSPRKYRRGVVEQVVQSTQMAQVFMPDTGERMVVGTKKMLLLHEDFVKLYPYAMSAHVRLCNLRPKSPAYGWGGDACRYLKQFYNKTMVMYISEEEDVASANPSLGKFYPVEGEDLPPSVSLFHCDSSRMLCLNSELVGERLALPLSESGSLDLDLSTSRSTQPTDEGDVIDKMLFKCKANLCQHPLTIDQKTLDWWSTEWKNDSDSD